MSVIDASFARNVSTLLPRRLDWTGWAAEAGLWLLITVCLLQFPTMPGTGLDPSWRQVMGWAWENDRQFGPELVFTYGPLGFLLAPTNTGTHYGMLIATQLLLAMGCGLAMVALSRAYTGIVRGWVIAYFALLVAPNPEGATVFTLVLATLAWSRWGAERHWGWALGLAALLAIGALEKFTHLLLATSAVLVLGGQALMGRQIRSTAALVGGFMLFLLAGWMIGGQEVGNLPAYLRTSLQLAAGYSRNMALPADPVTLGFGLLAIAALAGYVATALPGFRNQSQGVAFYLMAAVAAFLHWKHGFVRADAHTANHFLCLLFLVITLPALAPPAPERNRRRQNICLLLALALSAIGLARSQPDAITNALTRANDRVFTNVRWLLDMERCQAELKGYYGHIAGQADLATIRQRIGDSSVDILGYEQGYAVLNGFDYQPRPVFQSYMATTAALSELNARHLAGPNAPRFLLQKVQAIDHRLPALEDARAQLELLRRYQFVEQAVRFLVWERRDAPLPEFSRDLLDETEADWDEVISVPDAGDHMIWCEIDLTPTLLGRLTTLLYQPASVWISTTDATGFGMGYRFLPDAGRVGFLVAPHLVSTPDLMLSLAEGIGPRRLQSFSLTVTNGSASGFRAPFHVRFYDLGPLPRASTVTLDDKAELFRTFSHVPIRYDGLYGVASGDDAGNEVVAAHPPCTIDFRVPVEARGVRVGFGFLSAALPHIEQTDGVEFSLSGLDRHGSEVQVFSRLLDPASNPAHRDAQWFEIELAPEVVMIQLRTGPGPANDLGYDWVYWRDLVFLSHSDSAPAQ